MVMRGTACGQMLLPAPRAESAGLSKAPCLPHICPLWLSLAEEIRGQAPSAARAPLGCPTYPRVHGGVVA